MSLALLFHYLLLSMFRMLVHPSSGACDLLWIYFMCCIALVRCVLVLRCGSAGVVWYPYAGFNKDVALVDALLFGTGNVKQKMEFWVHPIRSQRLRKRKFCPLYEWLKVHPQMFLDISACPVQQLIDCWFLLVQFLHFKIPEWQSPCHQKEG